MALGLLNIYLSIFLSMVWDSGLTAVVLLYPFFSLLLKCLFDQSTVSLSAFLIKGKSAVYPFVFFFLAVADIWM